MNKLLQALGLMRVSEHGRAVREAFKAGWRTNAVGEETHTAEYLDGCEQVDFEEYERLGIALYLGSIQPIDDEPRDDWEAKFKKAITDLAAARDELSTAYSVMDRLNKQIIELTPDALAMRRKRERDRDRRKAKVS